MEQKIDSADGTTLLARVTGEGPPLVTVHGTTGTIESFGSVEEGLAAHHTVWTYDRRGRGGSGDADEYSFEREVEDLVAVLRAAGDRPHLLGHSFGGCVSITAAARPDVELASLIVYEPPFNAYRRKEVFDRSSVLIEQGDAAAGLEVQLVEAAGVSPDEFAFIRSIPQVWERFLSAAHTIPREVASLNAQPWDPSRYLGIDVPTLHLTGELTDNEVYLTHEELVQAIPHATHEVLTGQRHLAFATAPKAFVDAVLRFTSAQG